MERIDKSLPWSVRTWSVSFSLIPRYLVLYES